MSYRERDRDSAVRACIPLAPVQALRIDAGRHGRLLGASLTQRLFWFQVGEILWRVQPDLPEGLDECAMGFCGLHYDSDQLCVDGSTGALCGYHKDSTYAPPIVDYEYLSRKYGNWRVQDFCLFVAGFNDESSTGTPEERGIDQLNACAGHVRFACESAHQTLSSRRVVEIWHGTTTRENKVEFTLAKCIYTELPCDRRIDRPLIVDAYDGLWMLDDDAYQSISLYRSRHSKIQTAIGGVWSAASDHLCETTRVGTWRQCLVLWGLPAADSEWHVALIVPPDERSAGQARVLLFKLLCAAGDKQNTVVLDNERGCLCAYTVRSGGGRDRSIDVFQLPAQ